MMRYAMVGALLSLGGAEAKVPEVAAGPALYETAAAVATPIDGVVVYSDRARITRQGRADLKPGVHAVRLSDLPGTTLLDTLRVGATGATVLRVEAGPVQRIRAGIDAVEELVVAIEQLQTELARLAGRRAVLAAEMGLMAQIAPATLPSDESGRTPPSVADAWSRTRSFVGARRTALSDAVAALDTQLRDGQEALQRQQAKLAQYDVDAFTPVQRVEVLAVLQVEKARPTVSVDYFVGGATWKPAYTVELAGDSKSVTLRTAGRVRQTTGEDWTDVALSLSTAVPGQGISPPRLDTWTLGESRDFTPKPRAQRDVAGQPLGAPPPPPDPGAAMRQARLEALRTRVAQARNAQAPAFGDIGLGGLGISGSGVGGGGSGVGYGRGAGVVTKKKSGRRPRVRPQRSMSPPPPPPAAPMEADSYAEESRIDFDDVEVIQRSIQTTSGSVRSGPPVRRTPLDLFEQSVDTRPRFNDQSLPAVLAGGLDYVWPAATRATVPSDPETHTVPLMAEKYPVSTRYEAAPALRTTAYLTATVSNTRETPILAGPVDIFAGPDYVGTGNLATTDGGGTLELPLGADEDIRIERRVLPKTKTEGVFSKEDQTRYVTEIDVANDKRRPITIRIIDQFPLGGVTDDVKVKRGKTEPKPEAVDDAGRMTFALEVPPRTVKTIRFEYTIERPADWHLFQR